jgi:hypothetical protein
MQFRATTHRRRTALAVLLVWLFGIGSGWANACLLQERSTHSHESPVDSLPAHQVWHLSPAHLGGDLDHPENGEAAKSACLKVCGDSTQSIVKQATDLELSHVVMAPPLVVNWPAPLTASVTHIAWLQWPAPRPGVPLRTRFSRLAL